MRNGHLCPSPSLEQANQTLIVCHSQSSTNQAHRGWSLLTWGTSPVLLHLQFPAEADCLLSLLCNIVQLRQSNIMELQQRMGLWGFFLFKHRAENSTLSLEQGTFVLASFSPPPVLFHPQPPFQVCPVLHGCWTAAFYSQYLPSGLCQQPDAPGTATSWHLLPRMLFQAF